MTEAAKKLSEAFFADESPLRRQQLMIAFEMGYLQAVCEEIEKRSIETRESVENVKRRPSDFSKLGAQALL